MKKAQTTPKEQTETRYSSNENLPLYYIQKRLLSKARRQTKEKLSSSEYDDGDLDKTYEPPGKESSSESNVGTPFAKMRKSTSCKK